MRQTGTTRRASQDDRLLINKAGRAAECSEFDLDNALWEVPKERLGFWLKIPTEKIEKVEKNFTKFQFRFF